MTKRNNSSKILLSGIILVIYLILSFCLKAESNSLSRNMQQRQRSVRIDLGSYSSRNQGTSVYEEKMVTVNVASLGRKNPFMPYKKSGVATGNLSAPANIPPPPMLNNGSQLKDLTEAKVNGILYDPYGKSVAIINIRGTDYMLNQYDSVFGFYIKNITRNTVTIKYGSNVYNVSAGEVIGRDAINYDPVVRSNQSFGGGYRLPSINSNGY